MINYSFKTPRISVQAETQHKPDSNENKDGESRQRLRGGWAREGPPHSVKASALVTTPRPHTSLFPDPSPFLATGESEEGPGLPGL